MQLLCNQLIRHCLCGCYIIPQKKVTQEKGTPLPRPFGLNLDLLKKSGGRPNSGLKALRQVRPTSPVFLTSRDGTEGKKSKPVGMLTMVAIGRAVMHKGF